MRLEGSDPRTAKWEPAAGLEVSARKPSRWVAAASLCIDQNKPRQRLVLPVSDILAGYVAKASAERQALVVDEKTGRQYKDHEFSHAAADVREAAELPGRLWVADLRRACINELAFLGASDDQLISVSGHTKRQTLSVYSLTEYRKALEVMQRR